MAQLSGRRIQYQGVTPPLKTRGSKQFSSKITEVIIRCLQDQRGIEPEFHRVPEIYAQKNREQQTGGIKISTLTTYIAAFTKMANIWAQLGFTVNEIFTFPTSPGMIKIFLVHCADIKIKRNTWTTIRINLAAADKLASMCGVAQTWSDNPDIAANVQYCKRICRSKGSNTKPLLAQQLKQIISYALRHKVYKNMRIGNTTKSHFVCDTRVVKDQTRMSWFIFIVGMLTVTVTALRGTELFYSTKPQYQGYGIKIRHLQFGWMDNKKNLFISKNPFRKPPGATLHFVRINIPKHKTEKNGNITPLVIGATGKPLCPANLILQLILDGIKHHQMTPDDFVFGLHAKPMNLKTMKQRYAMLVVELKFPDPERWRFHGGRMGYATQLRINGVPISLICFGGRWMVMAGSCVFGYIRYELYEMLPLAHCYLYQSKPSTLQPTTIDLDFHEDHLMTQIVRQGQYAAHILQQPEALANQLQRSIDQTSTSHAATTKSNVPPQAPLEPQVQLPQPHHTPPPSSRQQLRTNQQTVHQPTPAFTSSRRTRSSKRITIITRITSLRNTARLEGHTAYFPLEQVNWQAEHSWLCICWTGPPDLKAQIPLCIQCDICNNWEHAACAGIAESQDLQKIDHLCRKCDPKRTTMDELDEIRAHVTGYI